VTECLVCLCHSPPACSSCRVLLPTCCPVHVTHQLPPNLLVFAHASRPAAPCRPPQLDPALLRKLVRLLGSLNPKSIPVLLALAASNVRG